MSSYYNGNNNNNNRRRRGHNAPSLLPSFSTVIATAVVAVGTYHAVKWAWERANDTAGQKHSAQAVAAATTRHEDTEYEEEVEIVEEEVTIVEEEEEEEEEEDRTVDETTLVEGVDDHQHHLHHHDGGGSVASHSVRFLLPGRRSETPTRHLKDDVHQPAPVPPPPQPKTNNGGLHQHHPTQPPPNPNHHIQLRRQRMSRCRDETAMALQGFMATARKVIDERTDTLPETKALKRLRAAHQNQQTRESLPPPPPPPPGGAGFGGDSLTSLDESTFRRERERELWERVKVRSITRVLATAYTHTILFLVLTVQVNLLGGRLFEEQAAGTTTTTTTTSSKPSSDTTTKTTTTTTTTTNADAEESAIAAAAASRLHAYQSSHRLVLTHTYRYFFERGLHALIDSVERAVSTSLAGWDVLNPAFLHMTSDQFEEGLAQARAAVKEGDTPPNNGGGGGTAHCRSLLRFLSPPPAPPLASTDHAVASSLSPPPSATAHQQHFAPSPPVHLPDDLARSILDETWDLLESPVLEDALKECLNVTFDALRDWHWGVTFEMVGGAAAPAPPTGAPAPSPNVTRPLATVLTRLKGAARSFHHDAPPPQVSTDPAVPLSNPPVTQSPYCAVLERLPSVVELADVSFS